MIHDVDETIREIVRRDVLNGSGVEVSFEAPTNDWAARQSGPALNFYLYDIREDLSRRWVGQMESRNTRGVVVDRREPPRRYKLSYLATAWTQRPEDEHRLLSAVLGAFIKSDILPEDMLQGSLSHGIDPVSVTIALPPPQDRSLSDVWNALGGELKPSLDLVVTAPFDPQQTFEVGPPVLEDPRLRFVGGDGRDEQVSNGDRPGRSMAADRAALAEAASDDASDDASDAPRQPRNKRSPRK